MDPYNTADRLKKSQDSVPFVAPDPELVKQFQQAIARNHKSEQRRASLNNPGRVWP